MERNHLKKASASLLLKKNIGRLVAALTFGSILSIANSQAQTQSPVLRDTTNVAPTPPKPAPKRELKVNLNEDGTNYFRFTFLNQTWLQFNESNPGSTVAGEAKDNTFDIGLRRTRIQAYGQLTDRVFFYAQFGQNNFNHLSARKSGNLFFHDLTGEYALVKNKLSLGAGLTGWSGLGRYASPSAGSILTLDAPLVQQATNDVNDLFLRKLSLYAKGKLGKFDYRIALSDPFVMQTAATIPTLGPHSNFSTKAPKKQAQGYFMYQFIDQESNLVAYTTGSYLGTKRVFNLGAGFVTQPQAMWHTEGTDTISTTMNLFAVDAFYDVPINKEKGTALTVYAAYLNYDFGKNYTRLSGPLNPANGTNAAGSFNGSGNNAPVYGTGSTYLLQAGYLLPKDLLGPDKATLQPYAQIQYSNYERLADPMVLYNVGINWLVKGHNSKISLDYQNRPIFNTNAVGELKETNRRGQVVLQYQIFFQ
ncbi:MAG: hypothetical protein V4714_14665 [Bacteroidota bacterium]